MNLNFTVEENEKLLSFNAAVRQATESAPAAVVLVGAKQEVLCECKDEANAQLIKKLFNKGLMIPS